MQIQPIDFLGQMQGESILKPLQLGVNIGLNSPTKLDQEKQRSDIDYQKEHTSLLQQQIAASQQDKVLAKRKFDLEQSAMQRVMDVYSDPNATLSDIDAANNAMMVVKPEIVAKIEAVRKSRESRINQFEENTFAKLFSVRDNPETLKQEIDNALIAAKKESNTDLADNLSRLKSAVEQDPGNPLIVNSIKAGLSFYPKGRAFLKDEEAADLARKKALDKSEGIPATLQKQINEISQQGAQAYDIASEASKLKSELQSIDLGGDTRIGVGIKRATNLSGDEESTKWQNRALQFVQSSVLANAKNMKGSQSDKELNFLLSTVPSKYDPKVKWNEWLNEIGRTMEKKGEELQLTSEWQSQNGGSDTSLKRDSQIGDLLIPKGSTLSQFIKAKRTGEIPNGWNTVRDVSANPMRDESPIGPEVRREQKMQEPIPIGATLPFNPKNKDAQRTIQRLERSDADLLNQYLK